MREYNIDIHIHSKFAYRTSKELTFKNILFEAQQKGIDVIGTGDILHQQWFKQVEPYFQYVNSTILLTTEVSVKGIHFLLIFPSVDSVKFAQQYFGLRSSDINKNGRCNIRIEFNQLITFCRSNHILIGMAHAFQQKGYIHKYKEIIDVDFIETGINFDPAWIERLTTSIPCIKSSDAHSLPTIARQYCTFRMQEMSFENFKKTLFSKQYTFTTGVFNVGLKYPISKVTVKPFLSSKCIRKLQYRIRIPLFLAICLYYKISRYSKKFNLLYKQNLTRYKGDSLYIEKGVPFKSTLNLNNLQILETTDEYAGKILFKEETE